MGRPLLGLLAAAGALLGAAFPAAADDPPGHPADPWFALEHVLDVAVEMAPSDWDRLRRQAPTYEWVPLGDRAECPARPFAAVYSWFAADVTVNGRRYGNVGVRKKGSVDSLHEEKPALKLRFDRFVEGQALGGALERITLNNGVQDPSLLNTCLAYSVFADAGLPAPRCNYAAVTVNGAELGLYVHVEDVERSLLSRVFADPGGDLYEGWNSDFLPGFRGAFEKKTNEANGDRSAVDAVIAALADPSPAGLEALAAAVDLDRFLTFWAAEALTGHSGGYAAERTNYHFYREPGGRVVFIPWDTDYTFYPDTPEVMARGAIAHRLYGDAAWRAAYARRLRELLDTVWNETELLRRSERMAAIVQAHVLPGEREHAAGDADRVRRFIAARRAELLPLAAGTPAVRPARAEPACLVEPTTFELRFRTTWGSKDSADPFTAGSVTGNRQNGVEQPAGPSGATAGLAGAQDQALLGVEAAGVVTLVVMAPDSSIHGVTFWKAPDRFVDGSRWTIDRRRWSRWTGRPNGAAVKWSLPPGAAEPEHVSALNDVTIALDAAGTEPGAAVSGRLYGRTIGPLLGIAEPKTGAEPGAGLIINEVAARGAPRDWFELYNAGGAPLALAGFVFADDLTDRGRRTSFPAGLSIAPGAYLRIELDADGWPGFALGRDEELGIWQADGRLVAQVDWREGESGRGLSYARVPDVTGPFRTVIDPTPGAPNARR